MIKTRQEEGGEKQIDTTSHSTARDEENGKKDGTEKGAVEDEAASYSHHLRVLQIIAFHKTFYNERRAIFSVYVKRYTT
jgi:hypothetical protein